MFFFGKTGDGKGGECRFFKSLKLHITAFSPHTVQSVLIRWCLFSCFPDQEEAARCGRLPGGPQGGLHSPGHRLQRGEPHVDEEERPWGEEAHQRHPPAPSDLQRRELLWGRHTETFFLSQRLSITPAVWYKIHTSTDRIWLYYNVQTCSTKKHDEEVGTEDAVNC